VSIKKPLAFLCLFILTVALNVGLMFHVQAPAFAHLEWLAGWYWVVPYIMAVLIVRNLPRKVNRSYILYASIAMTGFSFIAFILMDRSAVSYLVVDTLMLGAFGIFNLFWWTILGEILSFHQNPAKVLGIGLSANVLGAMIGAIIGNAVAHGSGQELLLLALGVVCVALVLLPPLYARLAILLKHHAYMAAFSEIPPQEQKRLICDFGLEQKLTEREREIASLLLTGKTYQVIAKELCVSENTVKTHAKNVYAKVGVHNRTELMNRLLKIKAPLIE
jgi:DNA-binding CsgD family transcriptional regulator